MKNMKTVLIVVSDKERLNIAEELLQEQKYKVVTANNSNEARLKFSNEEFHMVIVDMTAPGFSAKNFIESIRRKEDLKSVKNILPVLVLGDKADEFHEQFSMVDNVKYMEFPFTKLQLKKKLLTFTGHSEVISNNTKIVEKNEYLITEGGVSHEMYWILSGKFIITKMNHDNQNVIIGEVFPGELVGEMSFLDSLPRSASVRAVEQGEVLVIPHKKFIDVLENQPRWFRSLMQTMSHRLRDADKKIARKIIGEDKKRKKRSNI